LPRRTATFYAAIRTLEMRLTIARENAALQKRSLEITERLFKHGNDSELDVQQAKSQYLSTLAAIPQIEGSLRQTQNALSVLLARPPGPLPEMAGGPGTHSADRTGDRRRHAGRDAAPPPRRARRRDATGGAVGADRRQRRRPLPVDRAARFARRLDDVAVRGTHASSTGRSAPAWCGTSSTSAA
jgi:hypothetical protein